MYYSKTSLIVLIIFSLIFQSCNRPLFVTHWSGRGKALLKKKGWGYPNHGPMAFVVCTNKLCLNKAERENKWAKKRFKGYKENKPVIPSDQNEQPALDTMVAPEESAPKEILRPKF